MCGLFVVYGLFNLLKLNNHEIIEHVKYYEIMEPIRINLHSLVGSFVPFSQMFLLLGSVAAKQQRRLWTLSRAILF